MSEANRADDIAHDAWHAERPETCERVLSNGIRMEDAPGRWEVTDA